MYQMFKKVSTNLQARKKDDSILLLGGVLVIGFYLYVLGPAKTLALISLSTIVIG